MTIAPSSMSNFRADLTYYQEGWGGSHEFKTGFWGGAALSRDVFSRASTTASRSSECGSSIRTTRPPARAVPPPLPVAARNLTTAARDRDIAIYVQDTWKPRPR